MAKHLLVSHTSTSVIKFPLPYNPALFPAQHSGGPGLSAPAQHTGVPVTRGAASADARGAGLANAACAAAPPTAGAAAGAVPPPAAAAAAAAAPAYFAAACLVAAAVAVAAAAAALPANAPALAHLQYHCPSRFPMQMKAASPGTEMDPGTRSAGRWVSSGGVFWGETAG
eukprot:1138063-Pelagomonas_calceolata.AAC.12